MVNVFDALVFGRHRSWGSGLALNPEDVFSLCVRFHGTIYACGLHVSSTALLSGRKPMLEKLWHEFFSDPLEWWDHSSEKVNPRFPDFKHKKTQQSLWIKDKSNPRWVKAKLAKMAPGNLQSNTFPWNAKLRTSARAGNYKKTMDLFQQMQRRGVTPDKFTFVPVVNACSGLLALEEGRRIHLQIINSGFDSDVFVGTCLVDMYAKCGRSEDARRLFDKMPTRNVVTWNAMILGYVKCRQGPQALALFQVMQRDGVESNPLTFVGVLNACASIAAFEEGKRAHTQIIERGYESDVYVANSLVDMYAKCGRIEDAQRIFNKMPRKDVVAWNAMILGCVKCGQGQEALELFGRMQRGGVNSDPVTFVGVLNACASIAALGEGRHIHEQIIGRGYESDVYVANALVDMYVKCGSLEDARLVFSNMGARDVVSWSTMLAGYGLHGYAKEALQGFEQMCQEGVDVNVVTLVSLLSACSRGELVDEGMHYFETMIAFFNISPTLEHYACVVDLLGRAGHLHEAEDLVRSMPCQPDLTVWMSLLDACRAHGNVEMGERCAKRLKECGGPDNAAGHVLLSSIYAALGQWDRVHAVHHERLEGI